MVTKADWHFPKETLKFLKDLHKNNNRDWFKDNKSGYEQHWRDPAEEFAELMSAGLETLTGQHHESKIFRIHRDVRFSKDKTPYNTHVHISFFEPEKKSRTATGCSAPHWLFGLETDRLVLGAGIFGFEKDELMQYRQRIDGKDGEKLQKILNSQIKKGLTLHEPELKRVPKEFDADHPRGELLRRKSLVVWKDLGKPAIACEGNLVAECSKTFKTLKPVVDWLSE